MKTTNTGAPVIQVAGNVEHGDSGGPALDNQGNIVGVVSFGAAAPGSTSFLQASSSAQTLVQSLRLDTTPGPFQKAWSQAFTDYASSTPGHWHKAQQEFQQIATHYPQFKAITPYLDYITAQAKTEKVSQSTPQPSSSGSTSPGALTNNLAIIGGGVGVLLALLLFGAVALSRRRRKRIPVTPAPARLSNVPPPLFQNRPASPAHSTS